MAYWKTILLLVILIASNIWKIDAKSGGEITSGHLVRLCGDEIVRVHKAHCEEKQKRDLHGMFIRFCGILS